MENFFNTKKLTIRQLIVGSCEKLSTSSSSSGNLITNRFSACGSVTLIIKDDVKILVDCGNPNDAEFLKDKLSSFEIQPEDIEYLILTHGHIDHIGNLNLFKEAKIFSDNDLMINPGVYMPIEFDSNGKFEIMPQIKLWKTPGHTSGDLSLEIFDDDSNQVIIVAGDIFESEHDLENESLWQTLSCNIDLQRRYRQEILSTAHWIIPGHGSMFKNPFLRQT